MQLAWKYPVREWAPRLLVGAQDISRRVLTTYIALLNNNSDSSLF